MGFSASPSFMVVSALTWLLRVCGWGSPLSTASFGGWPSPAPSTPFMVTTAKPATGFPDVTHTTTIWCAGRVAGRWRSWPNPVEEWADALGATCRVP